MNKRKKSSSSKRRVNTGSINTNKRHKIQHLVGSRCNSVDDIIIEILSRLPGSSLARFVFVSMKWLTLITTDPFLSELHLHHGFKSASPSMVTLSYTKEGGRPVSCLSIMDDKEKRRHPVLTIKGAFCSISPSCNGLICIYGGIDVALFNPTTREGLALSTPIDGICLTRYFLGYLPTTKEYKVVRFLHPWSDRPQRTRCEVLTVGTCSWRRSTLILDNHTIKGGVCINGFMYWIVASLDRQRKEIVSLDLNDEKFETHSTIHFNHTSSQCTISEVDGHLCVGLRSNGLGSMNMWVLENIPCLAWIKRYTLTKLPSRESLKPILFGQGKIMFDKNGVLHDHIKKGGLIQKNYKFDQVHIEGLVNLQAL